MIDNSIEEKENKQKKERADRLRYLREEVLRLSRAEMEQKLNISESSLENWEYARFSGITERGAKKIQEACKKVGIDCTVQWLMYGIGLRPTSPFLQHLNKALGISSINEAEIIAQELNTFHQLNIGGIDTIINDNGMLPCFMPGDYVAGIQLFNNDIEQAIDKPCIVKTIDGKVFVRLVKKQTDSKSYSLVCSNSDTSVEPIVLNDVTLLSAAPVIWIRRKNNS